jgi:hypothetical protein
MSFIRKALALGAVAAIGSLSFAPAAQAATAPEHGPKAAGTHCVLDLSSRSQRCFATFPAALSHATGGTVRNLPGDVRAAQRDPGLTAQLNAPKPAAASVVIGIQDWNSGRPGTKTWTVTAAHGCTASTGDIDWEISYVGDAWNDNIASFTTYNHCDQTMFDNANFGGDHTGWIDHTDNLGAMKNRTSSIQWS